MSASGSFSKGNSLNTSQFGQSISNNQNNALGNLYQAANDLFTTSNGQIGKQMGGIQNSMQQTAADTRPAFQDALKGGAYQNLGIGNTLMDSLNQSLSTPSSTQQIYADIMGGKGNNYADAMKAGYTADATNATNNMLRNLDARSAGAGMSGSSQHGIAEGLGLQGINNNLQRNLAETGYNTFDKDLQNKLGIAQQADSNTLSRQNLLSSMLGQQQGTVNNAMTSGADAQQNLGMGVLAPIMSQWNALGNWANAVGSPTVLSNGTSLGKSQNKAVSQSGGFL